MIIQKKLKGAEFLYDTSKGLLVINGQAELKKLHMFSLMRFLVRISQKLSSKRRKNGKTIRTTGKSD